MRVVFMGTPPAAVPALRAVAQRYDVVAAYTRVDKPRGRGRRVSASAVKEAAAALDIPIEQPKSLRSDAEVGRLADLAPDAVAVVAYGMILPPAVLRVPRLGCVNVHFSLLPRWRGAAPVERALLAGDAETGVTTMLMDEGMDTGPMLLQAMIPLGPDDTTGTVTERLSVMGGELLVRTLEGRQAGRPEPVAQPAEGVTLAPKVEASEAELDFAQDAEALRRRVHAFNPAPGAFAWWKRKRLKVWRAAALPGDGEAGTIVAATEDGIDVQTARGRLRLIEVQPEGKRTMAAGEFVRGYRPEVGRSLARPAV